MTSFAYNFHYKPTGITSNSKPAGLSLYGIDGNNGEKGFFGSSIYFFDSLIITDLQKEEILTRIDNGININGNGMSVRPYNNGDLIICKKENGRQNNIYKIIPSYSMEHKFDIERWGMISQPTYSQDLIELYLNTANIELNIIPKSNLCKIPVNRSFDSSTELFYTDGDGFKVTSNTPYADPHHIEAKYSDTFKTLFGFFMTPSITFPQNDLPNLFDFYLKITISLTKGLIGKNGFVLEKGFTNEYNGMASRFRKEPMNPNRNILKFEKILEIPLNKYVKDEKEHTLIDDEHKPTYISDMSCDKLHPADNNINVSFFEPIHTDGWDVSRGIPNSKWFKPYFGSINGGEDNYCLDGVDISNTSFDKNNYFTNNIRSPFMEQPYDSWHPMMQFSKRSFLISSDYTSPPQYENEKCIVNFRSGESAYFSGMVPLYFEQNCFSDKHLLSEFSQYIGSGPYHTYDSYVTMQRSLNNIAPSVDSSANDPSPLIEKRNEVLEEYIVNKLLSFLFNNNNTFELVYVNKETGLTRSKRLVLGEINRNTIS